MSNSVWDKITFEISSYKDCNIKHIYLPKTILSKCVQLSRFILKINFLYIYLHIFQEIKKDKIQKKSKWESFSRSLFLLPKPSACFFVLNWNDPRLSYSSFFFSVFSISLRNSSSSYFGTMKLLCGSKLVSFTTYRLPQTAIPAMPRGFYCCHSYLRSPLKKTPDLNQMTRCWPLDWYYYQYLVPFFKAHKKNSSPHLMSRKSKYCTLRL